MLTPSASDVAGDARVVRKEREEDQIVQVYTLHQDPEVISQDEVLPEGGEHFTVPIVLRLIDQPVILAVFDDDVRQSDAGHEKDILEERHEGSHDERGEQVHVQYIPWASQFPTSDGRQT